MPRKKAPRKRQRPRAARKDAQGIRLTSDQRMFTILPSDFAAAMRPPSSALPPASQSAGLGSTAPEQRFTFAAPRATCRESR
jgi:hypothetical protein